MPKRNTLVTVTPSLATAMGLNTSAHRDTPKTASEVAADRIQRAQHASSNLMAARDPSWQAHWKRVGELDAIIANLKADLLRSRHLSPLGVALREQSLKAALKERKALVGAKEAYFMAVPYGRVRQVG